jgi:hypothetical protein
MVDTSGCRLLLMACSEGRAGAEPISARLCIVVAKPEDLAQDLGPFCRQYRSTLRKATLGFRVPGRIVRRYYDVGAEVSNRATLLANLDPTDQQNQLRAAQGDLAQGAGAIDQRPEPMPAASKNCSTVAWAPKRNSTPRKPT